MVVAMVMTLGILLAGVVSMTRGGEVNRKWGNKLMRARVLMQGVAIILFLIAVYLLKQGG